MPSTPHEVLIVALREQPGLLGALVSKLTGVQLPRSLQPVDATLRSELAIFAAWAMQHRHGPGARAVVERAFELTERLPRALRRAQQRAIHSVLSERMLELLREASMNPDKIPETPAARKLRLFLEAQGRKKGRAEGEAKGRAEGEAKGRQDALLTLLRARGLSPSQDDEARIRACADAAKLDRWIARAATATTVREALGTRPPGSRARPRAPGRSRPTPASRS
ncbi:hypothetical protein [Sorangium sp. So ce1097]|uniref:hypothetical protein n=1 Tax=Sorangium sp. So ce1097 TaxID=3133330 RepID=UPI003F5E8BAC